MDSILTPNMIGTGQWVHYLATGRFLSLSAPVCAQLIFAISDRRRYRPLRTGQPRPCLEVGLASRNAAVMLPTRGGVLADGSADHPATQDVGNAALDPLCALADVKPRWPFK
jgi:hypothetical protein